MGKRKWKIFVIQHAHTDIGYTDRQEKTEISHIDYIRQALSLLKAVREGRKSEWDGYKWTCETFWPVEKFLADATEDERADFKNAVTEGKIGLSASYLNLTELVGMPVLDKMTKRAVSYAESIGTKMDSAMTADINGYSWGFSQCMADNGVENLFTCIHALHGMFPAGRKQYPFWWKTPDGKKILVWNGEHYHFGNDLGLVPGAIGSYIIKDEFNVAYHIADHYEIAEKRITRYLRQLEKEEYPYDFIPLAVSSILIDNAPPGGGVMDYINSWNEEHEDIRMEMTTPGEFFSHLRKQEIPIPEYEGDWPDWWSDGVASTPVQTKFYRDALRKYEIIKLLEPGFEKDRSETAGRIENALILYAEHTWGHSMTVTAPWDMAVQTQEIRKALSSYTAQDLVYRELDRICVKRGEKLLSPGRPLEYKVINPHKHKARDKVRLLVENWDNSFIGGAPKVIDTDTGSTVPCQYSRFDDMRYQAEILSCVDAQGEKHYNIEHAANEGGTNIESRQGYGIDGVLDIKGISGPDRKKAVRIDETSLETNYVRICWKEKEGIISWTDMISGTELLKPDRKHNAFTPVYEITPVENRDELRTVRFRMGRNRKSMWVERTAGVLKKASIKATGPVYGSVELEYALRGAGSYSVLLTAFTDIPRVDVAVRINKDNRTEPENVYVSMPFSPSSKRPYDIWIEKTGCLIRPGKDQIPGTCTDFYCVQEGMVLTDAERGLYIAMPDSPVIQLGGLEFGERKLMGFEGMDMSVNHLYSWILNNYWEVNFRGFIGGYSEFRYSVGWGEEFADPAAAIERCHEVNNGLIAIRTDFIGGSHE